MHKQPKEKIKKNNNNKKKNNERKKQNINMLRLVILLTLIIINIIINEITFASGIKTDYVINDHLGSASLIIDSDDDSVVWSADYEPFVSVFNEQKNNDDVGADAVNNKYSYNAKEQDDSTGFFYYAARHSDAGLGRFLSADSIIGKAGNPQELNRYAYVKNNPLKYTDPTGKKIIISGTKNEQRAITQWLQIIAGDYKLKTTTEEGFTIINQIPTEANSRNKQSLSMLREATNNRVKYFIMIDQLKIKPKNVFLELTTKSVIETSMNKLEEINNKIRQEAEQLGLNKRIAERADAIINLDIDESRIAKEKTGLRFDIPIILAHELLGHGLDYANNPSYSDENIILQESQAMYIENIVRKELGLGKRESYLYNSQITLKERIKISLGLMTEKKARSDIYPMKVTDYESLK